MGNIASRHKSGQVSLEAEMLRSWNAFMDQRDSKDLDDLVIPSPLKDDFAKLKVSIEAQGGTATKPDAVRETGTKIIKEMIREIKDLSLEMQDMRLQFEGREITSKEWRSCLSRIIDRIGGESTFFKDTITHKALQLTHDGNFSNQLKAALIPVENDLIKLFIRQPIFLPDIGLILYPGRPPSPKEVVTSLAERGDFPPSFTKLQECVADILSWPLYKRVGSFAVSFFAGLCTLPFTVAVRAALTVPRIFGISLLKKSALSFSVDPALDAAYSAMSTEVDEKPNIHRRHRTRRYLSAVNEGCPDLPKEQRKCAVENILLMRALGFSTSRIGEEINGARWNPKKRCYPKLERVLQRECSKLKIFSSDERQHLLDLDDSIWRLATIESRLRVMRIARDECTRMVLKSGRGGIEPSTKISDNP